MTYIHKPTATFLRASALDRAGVEFGPSIYSGGSSTGRRRRRKQRRAR